MYREPRLGSKRPSSRSKSRQGNSSFDRHASIESANRKRRSRRPSQDDNDDRNRHSQLRKQIAEKERQLLEMNQAAQRLRSKLGTSGSFQTFNTVRQSRQEKKRSRNVVSNTQKVNPSKGGSLRRPSDQIREDIRQKLGSPVYTQTNTQTSQQVPLRTKSGHRTISSGSHSPLRQRSLSPPVNQKPDDSLQRESLQRPVRDFSFDQEVLDQNINTLNSRCSDQRFVIKPQPVEYRESSLKFTRERISTLKEDNRALQQRLNMVMEELQVLQREKFSLNQSCQNLKHSNQQVELLMKTTDPLDVQNRNSENQITLVKKDNQRTQDDTTQTRDELHKLDLNVLASINECTQMEQALKNHNEELRICLSTIDQMCAKKVELTRSIQSINERIDLASKDQHQANLENIDMDTSITQMQAERNKLLMKFESLSIDYDQYVRDTALKKQRLFERNAQLVKKISARLLFQRLQKIQEDGAFEAFRTFKEYCDFDQKSYAKLKSFLTIAQRLSRYQKHSALNTWYLNSLKPYQTVVQNQELSTFSSNRLLKQKCFHAICKYHQGRMSIYKSKAESINKLWEKLFKNAMCDVKRALVIWRHKNRCQSRQIKILNRLAFLRHKQLFKRVMIKWKEWNWRIGKQVRIWILQRECAHKMFIQNVFTNFKEQILRRKHKRHQRLRHCLRVLQENVNYRKHFLKQNVGALRFLRENTGYHMRVCYDALKNNWKSGRHQFMVTALNENMDVTLARHAKFREDLENQIVLKLKMNICSVVRNSFGRKLFSYFKYWRMVTLYQNATRRTKLKDQMLFLMRQRILSYFLHWRKHSSKMSILDQKDKILRINKVNADFERNTLENEYKYKFDIQVLKAISKRKNNKVLKKFLLKKQFLALTIWKEKTHDLQVARQKNVKLFNTLFKRLLSESFTRYKRVYLQSKKYDKNLNTAMQMKYVLEIKQKRKIYNGFCAYIILNRKATTALNIMIGKVDVWRKSKVFKTWIENGNVKVLYGLNRKIINGIGQIEMKNKIIGEKDSLNQVRFKEFESVQNLYKAKARKLLANYMQRYYSNNTSMRFRAWKEQLSIQKQRVAIMKRTVAHLKKHQFTQVRNAFKHFMSLENQSLRRQKIKHTIIGQDDQIQLSIHHNELHKHCMTNLTKESEWLAKCTHRISHRIGHSIEALARRNLDFIFASRKRKIFEQWRQISVINKGFILSIKNVLEKSMFMKGFVYIQNSNRADTTQAKIKRHLTMIFMKYSKFSTANYFGLWKQNCRNKVNQLGHFYGKSDQKERERFSDYILNTKDQNCQNVFAYLDNRRIANFFKSWRNIKNHLKLRRKKDTEVQELFANMKYRRSLQKWNLRAQATSRRRFILKSMKQENSWRLKRAIFDRLLCRKGLMHDISNTISHLEKLIRDKNYVDSFKTIQSYANSKKLATDNFKRKSASDISYLLCNIDYNRLRRYFSKYKSVVKTIKFQQIHKKKIMLRIDNVNLRDAFRKWRIFMQNEVFAQEMNETGPITEFVFEAKRCMYNLIDFMRYEHYDEETLNYWVKFSIKTNERQMWWMVKRLKIPREDRQAMVKCMEHWKMWLGMKRLFAFHLKKGNHSVVSVKCDMRWAFNHWRIADNQMIKFLDRHDFKSLKSMNIIQAKVLDQMAEKEAEGGAVIAHLNVQRDELVDKYLIAQKLALCLFSVNRRKDMGHVFGKWKKFCHMGLKADGEAQIYQAVQYVTVVKTKAVQLTKINTALAEENDSLRQYTLDGFHVAKDVQQLSIQRDSLKEELEGKDETIQRLLDDQRLMWKQLNALGVQENETVGIGTRFDLSHNPLRTQQQYI